MFSAHCMSYKQACPTDIFSDNIVFNGLAKRLYLFVVFNIGNYNILARKAFL